MIRRGKYSRSIFSMIVEWRICIVIFIRPIFWPKLMKLQLKGILGMRPRSVLILLFRPTPIKCRSKRKGLYLSLINMLNGIQKLGSRGLVV